MKDWFTVEKIDNNTFAISEYKHWEETHCYLLCGNEKAILIDTGLGVENIKEITDSLTKLPIMVITSTIQRTDLSDKLCSMQKSNEFAAKSMRLHSGRQKCNP